MSDPPRLGQRQIRRLALARAGLLEPDPTGLPGRSAPARGATSEGRARRHALAVIDRFGYLQLDSVAVSGARTHAIVLGSRLPGFPAPLAERLLAPREPLFEYWGHEACWLPLSLYPYFEFRRREFRIHPWWGDLLGEHRVLAEAILRRVETEGPLRSLDLDGERGGRWWQRKLAKRVVDALWSAGELAVRERRSFQRSYDLTERVIPASARATPVPEDEALEALLLAALDGHGWAGTGTLAATWRLSGRGKAIRAALDRLVETGRVVPCSAEIGDRTFPGWIRPRDLVLAERLGRARPRRDRGVLLSPFDPVLWDRTRVQRLFGFEQSIEIYKPPPARRYGYYCLPVLAGEHLVARVDLKALRAQRRLQAVALHYERAAPDEADRKAVAHALARFAGFVGLALDASPRVAG